MMRLALPLALLSFPAMACMENEQTRLKRFAQFDANHDGFVDKSEYNSADKSDHFEGQLRYFDKDGDGKFSPGEFTKIAFVRCGG